MHTLIIRFQTFWSERTYVPTANVVFSIQVSYGTLDIGNKFVNRKARSHVRTGSVLA